MKKLIIPEDVHAHGIELKKGSYSESDLQKAGYKGRQVAQLVARTAAHWKHEAPAQKAKPVSGSAKKPEPKAAS